MDTVHEPAVRPTQTKYVAPWFSHVLMAEKQVTPTPFSNAQQMLVCNGKITPAPLITLAIFQLHPPFERVNNNEHTILGTGKRILQPFQ